VLELNLEAAIAAVREKNAKTVAVQVPEGLKGRVTAIAGELEKKTGATVFSFVDPCYGACDIADTKAKMVGAELLLHFGHNRFPCKSSIETVYLPMHYKVEGAVLNTLASGLFKELGMGKNIALCATAQYLHLLAPFGRLLEKKGLRALIGRGRGIENGQVLGCNYSSAKSVEGKANALVFLGDGLFHPLGLSLCCSKRVFAANPLDGRLKELRGEKELFLKKRYAVIAKAMGARAFGIIVSSKRGQLRAKLGLELKKKIEAKGKRAFLLVGDLIKPEYLLGISVDALVSTACPRIALDDASSFRQPLLNPFELSIVLGEKRAGDYTLEELV
jgi:2-(3-amino-3-carboxypropyl)histidine synthase